MLSTQLSGWAFKGILVATISLGILMALAGVLTFNVQPASAHEGEPHILVFSKTAGFRHASIPNGVAAIKAMGAEQGWTVDATEDASQFNDENLAQYDAVVWLSTTGDVLNAEQQASFERYIQGGGGYTGIHAAADTEYGWDWYGGLVGAYFDSHPPGTPTATIKVADRTHPSTNQLPAEWERTDEWYNYRTNPRGDVHVLATLDEGSYSGGNMGNDHPTAWCQDYDGGRSWYTGGGHTSASFSEELFLEHIKGGIQTAAGLVAADCGATLWENFDKVSLDDNTSNPMELDIASDGRVFYIERNGELNIVDPTANSTEVAGQIDVYQGQEDGLLGIALDPEFDSNGWIYLYYAPNEGVNENVLSRFTIKGNSLDLSSEVRMLSVGTQRDQCCHAGGALEFDPSGDLYIATGDDTNPFASGGYTPIDERDGRQPWDAQRTSGNTNDLRGKVLRITPQPDGTYTIPEGNLFPEAQDAEGKTLPEIYGMGFRNPFRIGMDPATGTLLVADYGPDAGSADPDRGPEGRVEWNRLDQPGNYGWPYCVGANTPYNDYDFATGESGAKFDCANGPTNDSPNNTGLTKLPPAIAADIWYGRSPSGTNAPELGTGGAPMAGPVYRFDENLESDTKWPAYYDGAAVFGEWGKNQMWEFRLSGEGKVYELNRLLTSFSFKKPMAMEFGPNGSLYVIEWGSGFGGNNDDSGVYRIDYVKGSRAPIAKASADPTSGPSPLEVNFSSEGSRDPDSGDTITEYSWDFGDGATSSEPNPTHTYEANGTYEVQLVVTDSNGKTGAANLTITVGNTKPEVELKAPVNGGFFDFGDQIAYDVSVTDAEDGSTANGDIDCSSVTLQSSLGHEGHAHPIEQLSGCDGLVQTTRDEGHPVSEELFWVLEASYKDGGGDGGAASLTGRDLNTLHPKRTQAEFYDSTGRLPGSTAGGDAGVRVENTGDSQGGGQNIGWIEDGDWVSFETMNLANIDSLTYRVASSGAGGRIEVHVDAPDGPKISDTGFVSPTGGWQTYKDVQASIDDPGGVHELFFVFRNENTDGGLMNLNWIDFNGKGVSENAAPSVTASAEPTNGTAPLDVNFSGEATDPENEEITYKWDFGDGSTATEPNTTHTYETAGKYTATLTATDARGAIDRASVNITVDAPSSPPIACVGDGSDEFNGTDLDRSIWTKIVREDQTFSVGDGSLTLPTAKGDIYQGTNNATNLILQPAPSGAWQATAKVSLDPTQNYQQAGLVLYGDNDNYAKVDMLYAGARRFEFIYENGGSARNQAEDKSDTLEGAYPKTFYVRLVSDGTDLTAFYSADGDVFTRVGRSAPLSAIPNPHVGVFALNGNTSAPAIDADFDWFHISSPGDSEDVPVNDEFDGNSLDGCRWDSIVRYDPDNLQVGGGELQITTTQGDIYGGGNSDPANLILQKAPAGDWTVETKVTENLSGGYSQAGLMTYIDDDNYVKFDVISDGTNQDVNRIELRSEVNAAIQSPQPNANDLPANPDGTWWLRLTKTGDSYAGAWSIDGETWNDMSESVPNSAVSAGAAFGVYAIGVNGSGQDAAFDYFHLLDEEPEDTTAPTVESSLSRERNADGTYKGPVEVTLNADDANGSGVDTIEWQEVPPSHDGHWHEGEGQVYDGPFEVTGEGEHVIQYRATDKAGNTSSVESVSFTIRNPDTTAPTTNAQLDPPEPDGNNGWYTQPVTATITANDGEDGSGVESIEYRLDDGAWTTYDSPITINGEGGHVLRYRATDKEGNTSEVKTVSIKIDTKTPVTTAELDPPEPNGDPTPGYEGTYNTPVEVTLTAKDATSGVAGTQYRLDDGEWSVYTEPIKVSEEGKHVVAYRSVDKAGNVEEAGTVSFEIKNDACPDSDLRNKVWVGEQHTNVDNIDTGDGCTINDLIKEERDWKNHGQFMGHVNKVTKQLVADDIITKKERQEILEAASKSDVGRKEKKGKNKE